MPDLPSRTVTFLFTDVEGSTTRWERRPQTMRQALTRHDALLHEGITAHGGVVLTERGEGDSFFALFARPSDALAAACALQRALAAEPWPEEVAPIQVRMALHTGEAGLWGGQDYRGAAVNRCARLRAVAHGGQVLLSGASYELVRDMLPPEVTLRDLGEHRLKDLTRPEHIFQVLHPDLPAAFPLLKTLVRVEQALSVLPRDAAVPARPSLPSRHGVVASAAASRRLSRTERQAWALEHLRTAGPLSPRAYAEALAVSVDTALRDLQELVDRGLVQAAGTTRDRRYVLASAHIMPAIHRTAP